MTLQPAVKAGLVDPGNLDIVRDIASPTPAVPADCGAAVPANCDTAVFLAPLSSYTITPNANGSVTVNQTGAIVAPQKISDGVDTLTNIEQLKFTDQTVRLTAPAAPTNVSATASNGAIAFASGTATVTWTSSGRVPGRNEPADRCQLGRQRGQDRDGDPGDGDEPHRDRPEQRHRVHVPGPRGQPARPRRVCSRRRRRLSLGLAAAPAVHGRNRLQRNASATCGVAPSDGGSAITGYQIQVRTGATVVRTDTVPVTTSTTVTGLTNGTAYNFRVQAVNGKGAGAFGASNTVTPATVPGQPGILAPTQGPAAVGSRRSPTGVRRPATVGPRSAGTP